MREIKYRAWDKSENQMARSVTELLFNSKGLYGVKLNHMGFEFIRRIKDVELMECTGLKDKNGKEIFEGDIVKAFQPFNAPQKAIVEFNDGCFDLKGIELTWRDYVKCFVVNHAIEIIGNIHENPELL